LVLRRLRSGYHLVSLFFVFMFSKCKRGTKDSVL
jgi:hypothetical protein